MLENRHALTRFIFPVTLENASTVFIGMIFTALIGKISGSALAAISTANLVLTFYTALFSMLTTGAAVLTARLIGAKDTVEASHIIEQSIILTVILSCALTAVSLALADIIMKLIIPTADGKLMSETVRYFRVLSLCLPGMMIYNVLMSVMRASGNSRAPLYTTTVVNVTQILFAYLFIVVFPLDEIGAGLSNVLCRTIGGVMSVFIVLRSHGSFFVRVKNLVKPDMKAIKRIVHIGLPTSFESSFVQVGYIVANSLVVGLGTKQATIYQVANTLQSFANLPLGICSATAMTFVGQRIGAGQFPEAKEFGLKVLLWGSIIITTLYLGMALFSKNLAPLYSKDTSVIAGTVAATWVLMGFSLPGLSINTVDPCLRVGGDVKFVLIETLIGVWAVRLPLSWLMGYKLNMGITGIYLANIISLVVRAGCGLVRYSSGKWMYKRV